MLKNYFKTALRNLLKNPFSSVINVMGLAAAIGCCMVVYAYLSLEFNQERQHTRADQIFMVKSLVDRDGEAEWFGITPTSMGIKLKEDFPQITEVCRIEDRGVIVKRGENVFQEWTRMVDPSFLDIFDFELKQAVQSNLLERGNVIINEKMAEKYFGDENPIGQVINMRFPGTENIPLKVTGVARVDEMYTSYNFDFLTNYSLLELGVPEFRPSDWSTNINGTFIYLDQPSKIETLKDQLTGYSALANSAQKDFEYLDFGFEKVSTLYHRSHDIRWDISRQSDVEGHWVLSIIALLMMVLACLNYLNIAISSAVKRLKEIGIRKVIGANRQRLVLQFMIENILLTVVAMIMGILLGALFFLPGLGRVFAIEFPLEILEIEFFLFIVGLLLLTAIASGAYPALYISKFQIVSILKGKTTFGRKNLLSKIFLSLQFVIACIAVVCGVLFTLNTDYQRQRPWGYDQKQTMMIRSDDANNLKRLKERLSQLSDIESLSLSAHHLGERVSSTVIDLPDRKLEGRRLDVEASYIKTMGLSLTEGRDFRMNYASDERAVIINETFAETLNWDLPLGKTFRYDSLQYTVIGVLEDFHFYSFWNDIEPTFLRLADEEDYIFLAIRSHEDKLIDLYEEIETVWAGMFPNLPFNASYQSQLFDDYFRNTNGHKVLMLTVAIIATLMTCLGLYGLISLNVSGRIREFSIRKVLGADLFAMSRAVSSHFLLFLVISLVIGGPLSFLVVDGLFSMIYNFPMPLTAWPFVGSVMMILSVIFATIGTQLIRVLRSNPTDGLRVE
jgi:ABC-type antimicrobial peptide transport system permease subunit